MGVLSTILFIALGIQAYHLYITSKPGDKSVGDQKWTVEKSTESDLILGELMKVYGKLNV